MTLKNNKKKIYLISNMYPSAEDPYFGVFVKNFCTGIQDNKNLTIVAKSVIKGQGRSFGQKLKKYVVFYLSILYSSLSKDFDIIYVHNVSHSILPLYPALIRKVFKKFIIVVNPHGEDMIITHKLDGILLKLSLPLIRTADQIVLPSHDYKNKVMKQYNLNPERIFVSASGGIDLNLFKPSDIKIKSPGFKTIGYVSRLTPDKGWDTLLLAVHKLVQIHEFKNLKVVFIGKGESLSGFLELNRELRLEKHVEYLGFRSQIELPEVFNDLDAFIFPTKMYESLGLVGLEAMACGIPVIGSDRGGLNDYIKDNFNGYSFECENVDSLVIKIIEFYKLSDHELLKMKANAIYTASQFSQTNVSSSMADKLNQLVSQ